MSIGGLSCSVPGTGGSRQANRSGASRRNSDDQLDRRPHRRERLAIGDVDLAAAARLLRVLVERRLEKTGRNVDAGQAAAGSSASAKRSPSIQGAPMSSNGLVVPRPSESSVPSKSTAPG